ncbi:MAG: hypothetical protein OXI63_10360 [Candidatus Poribacteria bacterium]|nr:hypothetical protein [Candidatus Poribacteria bacterium]
MLFVQFENKSGGFTSVNLDQCSAITLFINEIEKQFYIRLQFSHLSEAVIEFETDQKAIEVYQGLKQSIHQHQSRGLKELDGSIKSVHN